MIMKIPKELNNAERGLYIAICYCNIRSQDELLKVFRYSRKASLTRALEKVYQAIRAQGGVI